jgi:hypothetical protein
MFFETLIALFLFFSNGGLTTRSGGFPVLLFVIFFALLFPFVRAELTISYGWTDYQEVVNFATTYVQAFGSRSFTGPLTAMRPPSQLLDEATKLVTASLQNAVFAISEKTLTSAMDVISYPSDKLKAKGKLESIAATPDVTDSGLLEKVLESLPKSLIAFLAYHGTMTTKRYWIKVDVEFKTAKDVTTTTMQGDRKVRSTVSEVKEYDLFISIPDLVKKGNHGALVMAFKQSIAQTLVTGGQSKIIDFVKRKNDKWVITERLMFSKAIHLDEGGIDTAADRKLWKQDFDAIIRCMMDNKKDAGVLPDPVFFK